MYTYYLFNMNKSINGILKNNSYMLFKNFDNLKKSSRQNLDIVTNLYESLTTYFDKIKVNNFIMQKYNDNKFYQFDHQIHKFYNKYLDESSSLIINNSFAIYKTNNTKMELLKELVDYNIFVCDFENKKYFWLDEIYC